MDLSITSYLIVGLASLVIGMSKSGVKGIFIITVTLMALVFGSKASTGVIVPLLICADILAVIYYKRYVDWKLLLRFLPWMIFGVLIGVLFGKDLPEESFKNVMAGIILFSVGAMIYWEKQKDLVLSNNKLFVSVVGILAGVTTMIGNLAGPFSNIFFLAARIPKNEFIGTAAWLFFIINLFKLPFHIFVWETITLESLRIDLYLLPAMLLGFWMGLKVIVLFKESFFRKFILIGTAIGAILLIFK